MISSILIFAGLYAVMVVHKRHVIKKIMTDRRIIEKPIKTERRAHNCFKKAKFQ